MARVEWSLGKGRPCIHILLTLASNGQLYSRTLLADTGAGSRASGVDLILHEGDCLLGGGVHSAFVTLSGAFVGSFPLYDLPIQIPALGFADSLAAVGVPSISSALDGIACFRFLNQFHYGNFGNPDSFGLEA